MASPGRRSRLRFSDLPDQDDPHVTANQNADEYDPQDLHDEEVGKEEEEEEEEALDQVEYQPKEVDSANFFSKLFWCWLDPLFCIGLRGELHREHLRVSPKSTQSQRLLERFEKYWSHEKSKGRSPKLMIALFRILWPKLLLNFFLAATKLVLSMALAILVGLLSEYFVSERTEEQTRNAYLFALGLTLSILLSAFVHNHGFLQAQEIGMLSRIITSGAIFQKSLQLDQKKMGKLTISKVLNLAAADAGSLDFAFLYTAYLVLAPLHVLAVWALLWWYIGLGPSTLAGLGLFILWIPMQLVLSKMYATLRLKAVKCTDRRVRAMTDILSGIKVLKMYAWESVFKKLIFNIRRKEIKYITVSALFRASNDGFFLVFIALFNLFTFVTYTLTTGNPLTPNIVFTSFTLVTGLRLSTIVYMVEGVLGFQQARVALRRIQELLDIDVESPSAVEHSNGGCDSTDGNGTIKDCNGTGNVLSVIHNPSNGMTLPETKRPNQLKITREDILSVDQLGASWATEEEGFSLNDISFTVKKGEVFTIVGPVGNGKSSLLQAILGEMGTYRGSVKVSGSVAYTSQDPWVFGGTLRENILCGREFQEDWYWNVIDACSLREDLNEFTFGDLNQVGEHGLSLSGGQRSRVNLARAVYGEADLYLLDDPLSAVDPQVEHHLYEECIRKLLKNSAVVLVTHQLPIAQLSDKVMVMKEGKVVAQGTFEEIVDLATEGEDTPQSEILRDVLSQMLGDDDDDEEEEVEEPHALDIIAEVEEDDVFTDPPTIPPVCTTPCKPRMFPSKPQLMRRVTDMDLMRRSAVISPAITPKRPISKFGLHLLSPSSPRASRHVIRRQPTFNSQANRSVSPHDRIRRLSQGILRLPAPLLRSATVAEFSRRRKSSAFQPRPSVSSQAAVAPRIERDPDQYDYTSVAGLAGLGASAHLRFCAQPSSNGLATPVRAKPPLQRRKTMVTMLADQIPEQDSEEESDNEAVEEGTEAVEEEVPHSNKDSTKSSSLEDKGHGQITVKTYISYLFMGSSYVLAALIVALFLVSQANIVVAEWWLSEWAQVDSVCRETNSTINSTMNNSSIGNWLCDFSTEQLAGIYAGLVGSAMIMSFARAILFFYVCVRAAKKLHNKMFTAVLRVPMRFFDVNPIGRILNRFSKDVGFLDDILPNTFYDYLTIMLQFLSIMIVSGVANYYIFIPMVFVILAFILLRWYYLRTSREVKRLEAVARSPLFSHISTTLTGLTTIRSLKRQQMSLEWYHTLQDDHTTGWNSYIASTRWFGLRVDAIGAVFVGLVAFMAIPLADVGQSSLLGLSLAYCVSLAGVFQYGVRLSTEVESLMVSVERLMAYGKLPPEAPLETIPPINKPDKDWPQEGSIKMCELKLRYSAEDPLVLKGITCDIASSEKVGVIGRSGAGKSSLLTSLFRVAEPEGVLEIDGLQITDIGLHDLRSKISIIPQDPFLFCGTIRENLDPLERYTDEEIWSALEKVDMKEAVQLSPAKLLSEVTEGGGNFSVGQRQLYCLARAILRKDKVLVIDEATANVDMATDAIIQQTIRNEFDKCTVLTIAHRLHTIMDYDRIMVLGAGKLKEMDEPYALLTTTGSLLSDMVSQVGEEEADKLKQIALEAHKKRAVTGE